MVAEWPSRFEVARMPHIGLTIGADDDELIRIGYVNVLTQPASNEWKTV
eukprot:SAG11_NODE_18296_length_495_cov_0.648990_2_plen_49_part_00